VLTVAAFADAGAAYIPGSPWWAGWNLDPVLLLNLALAAYLYQRGLDRVWRAGAGRGVDRWQAGCFAAGLVVLLAALASPLDAASGDLSAAHMVQHMLVMNLAAPLLVLGSPGPVMLHGVPAPYRRSLGRLWRRLTPSGPVLPWVLYAGVLWGWHLPPPYEAALRHPAVHDLQHLTFFATGFVFWRAVLDRAGRRLGPGVALVYLFTTSLHATVLGVFMALAPRPWYPGYLGRTEAWGLTPLEDQQLAGLIMWMPACLAYAAGAVGILVAWLAKPEGEA
jgi:cytochrome c oxidase assembly factor CtaG